MLTAYLIAASVLGGLLTLFVAAGWGSYKDKKLPENPVLFRWFVTGVLLAGLGIYAWMYGAGGNPEAIVESLKETLEVKTIVEGLSSAVGGAAETVVAEVAAVPELTVGMPSF